MERCVLCSKHILPILHSFVLQFKKFLSLSLSQRRKDPKQSKWKDVYCAPSIVCQFYIAFFFSLRNSSLSQRQHTQIFFQIDIIGVNVLLNCLHVSLQASTDQTAVDLIIQYQVATFAFSSIQLLGIIAVMSQVAWQVFIIFIPVIAVCFWYQVSIQSDFVKILPAILC